MTHSTRKLVAIVATLAVVVVLVTLWKFGLLNRLVKALPWGGVGFVGNFSKLSTVVMSLSQLAPGAGNMPILASHGM